MNAPLSSEQVFAIGEVAIAHNWSGAPHYNGSEVVVIDGLKDRTTYRIATGQIETGPKYRIQTTDGKIWTCRQSGLRKKKPPAREDHQVTTWDKCIWQPRQVNA